MKPPDATDAMAAVPAAVPSKSAEPRNDVEGVGLCVCERVPEGV